MSHSSGIFGAFLLISMKKFLKKNSTTKNKKELLSGKFYYKIL